MSLKTKLKQRKADYRDETFCLDRPLMRDLEREVARGSGSGAYSGGKTSRIKELEKAVKEASVTIRVSSLPWGDYNALTLEHPPREGVNEIFNPETFYLAAAKATAVEVTAKGTVPIHEDEWDEFVTGLTDGEHDRLAGAVSAVNRNTASSGISPLG